MAKHDLPDLPDPPAHRWLLALVRLSTPALVLGLCAPLGCVRWLRDADFYAEQLTELLEQRSEPIEACYDRYLEQEDPTAKGTVVVDFEIEKRTGQITNIRVDQAQTDVPEPLVACVTDELAATKLEPADARTAVANFRWEFAPGSRKAPPADPFAEVQEGMLACYSTHLVEVDREATGRLVIDYAFDRASGTVSSLEVVAAQTSAPEPVVVCVREALRAATIDPSKLEDRNAAGRRSFTLQFEPVEP
jgi:hypothetical protein